MSDSHFDENLRAPSLTLLLREARAPVERLRFGLGSKWLKQLPKGDGHAVLVIPGFGADRGTMKPMLNTIAQLGYAAEDWGQGRNMGMRPRIRDALKRLIERLHDRHGGPVTLIGWSLGGVFARESARVQPQFVRRVITMGSPINRHPQANNMMPLFRLANRGRLPKLDRQAFERRIEPPPVPCTAIYSQSDGIVAWQACMEIEADNTENIEVNGSHFGLPSNREVLTVIAQRMAKDAEIFSDGR